MKIFYIVITFLLVLLLLLSIYINHSYFPIIEYRYWLNNIKYIRVHNDVLIIIMRIKCIRIENIELNIGNYKHFFTFFF